MGGYCLWKILLSYSIPFAIHDMDDSSSAPSWKFLRGIFQNVYIFRRRRWRGYHPWLLRSGEHRCVGNHGFAYAICKQKRGRALQARRGCFGAETPKASFTDRRKCGLKILNCDTILL